MPNKIYIVDHEIHSIIDIQMDGTRHNNHINAGFIENLILLLVFFYCVFNSIFSEDKLHPLIAIGAFIILLFQVHEYYQAVRWSKNARVMITISSTEFQLKKSSLTKNNT